MRKGVKIMSELSTNNAVCSGAGSIRPVLPPLPMFQPAPDNSPCCGASSGPPASEDERPGYQLCAFVEHFIETPAGLIPQVKSSLGLADWLGAFRARLGISRNRYRITPGLYSVGTACATSPVLVTANYKLSFDTLRRQLAGIDAWILVLDTRGVNVWCAAGKKTFGTDELIRQVKRTRLEEIVSQRQLILPQLGAPGIAAHLVHQACGFTVLWGPIAAKDLKAFLAADCQATASMRQLTFALTERLVLIPVEIILALKLIGIVGVALLLVIGLLGSMTAGILGFCAFSGACFFGIVLGPLLLPWLPGRSFAARQSPSRSNNSSGW